MWNEKREHDEKGYGLFKRAPHQLAILTHFFWMASRALFTALRTHRLLSSLASVKASIALASPIAPRAQAADCRTLESLSWPYCPSTSQLNHTFNSAKKMRTFYCPSTAVPAMINIIGAWINCKDLSPLLLKTCLSSRLLLGLAGTGPAPPDYL